MLRFSDRRLDRFLRAHEELPICPQCGKKDGVVKAGLRKSSRKSTQKYICRNCQKNFSIEPIKHTAYPTNVILSAITHYNLGNSQASAAAIIKRRFHMRPTPQIVSAWTRNYADLCTFIALRRRFDIDPQTIIFSKKFQHQQVFEYISECST
jgi:hypothetical protein